MKLPLPELIAALNQVEGRGRLLGVTIAAEGGAIAVFTNGTMLFDAAGEPIIVPAKEGT